MDALLQRRIQRYGWDKAANYYERYWQRQLEPAQEKLLEMALLEPGESLLDIACGTGVLTLRMAAQVGRTGEVFATDISENMIANARHAADEKHVENIRFERMEAEALDVSENYYDVAVCSLGLMYVPDPRKAVSEMFRATSRGGRLVASVWGQRRHCGWAEIFPIVERRVASEVCPLFFQQGAGTTLENTFRDAGLINIRSERLHTTLHYETAEEACGAAFAGGPVALAYSRFDEQTKKEAEAEYLLSIAPFKKGEEYFVPGEFVIAIGSKENYI
jgi:ubiquinone/menaquinone biosynthesis C-methylase UbiE